MKKIWLVLALLIFPMTAFSLSLGNGWNLISFSGDSTKTADDFFAARNFSTNSQPFTTVWGWDSTNSNWKIYLAGQTVADFNTSNGTSFGELTTIDPEHGYWINMSQAATYSYVADTSGSGGSSVSGNIYVSSWDVNTSETAMYIKTNNATVLVNVQSVTQSTVNGIDYVYIQSSGIPDYSVTMTQDLIDWLNNRPKASTDFNNGVTSASAGDVVEFGQDIGYNSNSSCTTGDGAGYWPPGPVCPEDVSHQVYIPTSPTPATTDCSQGLGIIGLILNGASVYGWGDGQSYNSQGVWQNLAPEAELYDIDICAGHAAQEDYHHHLISSCLMDEFDDEGTGHSPLYGFAADGYPIYGPYHANNVLAASCWQARDYDDTSKGGCGDGARTCLLVDHTDLSQGTTTASSNGPAIGAAVTSQSGNSFNADSGYFYEDYYFDSTCAAQGGQYLDEHNGHNHDDLGYHYHFTATSDNSNELTPSFPYHIGPTFAGALQENAMTSCATSGGTSGGTNNGPPQEAIDACTGKSVGDSCSFTDPSNNATVSDSCVTLNSSLVCGTGPMP